MGARWVSKVTLEERKTKLWHILCHLKSSTKEVTDVLLSYIATGDEIYITYYTRRQISTWDHLNL